jgi:hypothetical protein
MNTQLAAIQKAPEPIPDLRPPRGEIQTSFPEALFFTSALLFSLVVLIVGRLFHVRREPSALPEYSPVARFRSDLAHIAKSGEDSLAGSIRAVRRYLQDAFEIGTDGATNEEFVAEFAAHPLAQEESVLALHEFLVGSDLLRFAPLPGGPDDPILRASELVDHLELRRASAAPPPLPVAS